MGNYCFPRGDCKVVDTENRSNVLGAEERDLLKSDADGISRNNHIKSQNDNLESANHEKLDKMTVPGDLDQENMTSEKQQGNNKTAVERSENRPCETQTPVDEQKEILVACSKEQVRSSSSSIIIVDEAQAEKQQEVKQDIEEEIVVLEHVIPQEKNNIGVQKPATVSNSKKQKEIKQDIEEEMVVLEYVIPQEKNNIGVQKPTTVSNFKKQKKISSSTSVEHENKHVVKDIGQIDEAGRSCFVSELIAEKKTTAEHNETAVDNSLREQSQLDEEIEFHRLENEISEKTKLVAEYNQTLAQISKQKAERAKDLKSLENRFGTINLQNELKERAFIVGNMENEEKSCKMVTLNEGNLFKFGKGGLTHPKEKWVQLRLYPKGQVILDYAELFLSAKLERNQITSVERGEKYLSGDSSPYNGRVFAVHTTSTGKHRNMVFAAGSKELCEEWIECIKRAFA